LVLSAIPRVFIKNGERNHANGNKQGIIDKPSNHSVEQTGGKKLKNILQSRESLFLLWSTTATKRKRLE